MTQTTTLIDETLAKLYRCAASDGELRTYADSCFRDEARAVLEAFAAKLLEGPNAPTT